MLEEIDGPGEALGVVSEEPEMNFLDPDEEPEHIIADYVEAEDANSEKQGENGNEGRKKSLKEVIAEIKETPPTAPDDVAKQEVSKQLKNEEESDFRLRKLTDVDDFLQQEVEPDIPSQVSQLTVTTEYGGAETAAKAQAVDQHSGRRSLSKDADSRRISGDFTVGTTMRIPSRVSVESSRSELGESESEESQPEEAKTSVVFDRELLYEMHTTLTSELPAVKIKNNFLQRKMAEYFRKRKMDHVLKETDQQIDTQQKYWERLDTLHDLLDFDQRRRLVINAEVNDVRKERNENLNFVRKTMKELLERERDIGIGLIHTKTGKEIHEKVIERLLRRQWFVVEQVAQHRLKYIKIRNRVTEKQKALQAVDKLGPNLRLVDYEQLKIENRGFADKVEERDEELTKLRMKCDSIFQVLAHLREKSASATVDIIKEHQVLHAVGIEFIEARERSNYFKIERDRYRSMVNKIRDESGILLLPTLLKDMEETIEEANTTKKLLTKVKESQKTQLSQLRAIRKNIESTQNYRMLERGQQSPSRLTVICKKKASLKAKGSSSTQKL